MRSIIVIPILIRLGALSDQTFGIGRANMITSVMTFGRQFHLNNACVSKQSFRVIVHVFDTGEHWNVIMNMPITPCTITTMATACVIRRVIPMVTAW
jgi:hypothetical protein